MVLRIYCYVYINFGSRETRHLFERFSPAIARILSTCAWSGVTWKIRQPRISLAIDAIGIRVNDHFILSSFKILVNSAIKSRRILATSGIYRSKSKGTLNMHPHTAWAEKLHAYLLISWAFVLSPFSELALHHNQNISAAFFNEAGFLPAKEAPRISSSERTTGGSLALLVPIYTVFINGSGNSGICTSNAYMNVTN